MKYIILEPIHEKAVSILDSLAEKGGDDSQIVVIRNNTLVDEAFFERFGNVRYIVKPGTGIDTVDMNLCGKIDVITSAGANANGVAELVIGFMLCALRSIPQAYNHVKKGSFNRTEFMGTELKGKRVGFIGMGAIAKQVVRCLKPFNCSMYAFDIIKDEKFALENQMSYVSVKEIMKSDIVSLHVPLNRHTKEMINLNLLGGFNGILINTCRGGVIDNNALLKILDNITYCADVITNEGNLTEVEMKIIAHPNSIFTPHIGAQTKESFEKMCVQAVEGLVDKLK